MTNGRGVSLLVTVFVQDRSRVADLAEKFVGFHCRLHLPEAPLTAALAQKGRRKIDRCLFKVLKPDAHVEDKNFRIEPQSPP